MEAYGNMAGCQDGRTRSGVPLTTGSFETFFTPATYFMLAKNKESELSKGYGSDIFSSDHVFQ